MADAGDRGLLKTVSSISLATGLSRILGLTREMVMAYFFGAGFATDAFNAAYRIPNLLRDLFAEGALSSAFIPTFTKEKERNGREAAWRLANRVITALVIVLGILTVAILLFAPLIVRVYVPGFEEEKLALTVTMTRILSPFLLFVALAAVAMGMLNTCGKFFLPALAPATFNVMAILGMIVLFPVFGSMGIHPGMSLAVGAVVGGGTQFMVQTPALRREGFRFRPEVALGDPGLRKIALLMFPAILGLAATQINILVDTILASAQGDGAISWLQYGFRLIMLPIGLFGVAIATANIARVSKNAAVDDMEGLRANLAASLRTAALLTLPATAGLVALREPIIRVLFQRGEFTPYDTEQTAAAVLCYAIGLYAYSVTKIQVPTYYALGDARKPAIISVIAVALKICASLILIAVLRRIGISPFLGLALSTSLAAWVNFSLLSAGLRGKIGKLEGYGVVYTTFKVVVLSLMMGFACDAVHRFLESMLEGDSFIIDAGRLATSILVGMLITAAGAVILRIPEARSVLQRFSGGAGDR